LWFDLRKNVARCACFASNAVLASEKIPPVAALRVAFMMLVRDGWKKPAAVFSPERRPCAAVGTRNAQRFAASL
jgi:hypothetical protein